MRSRRLAFGTILLIGLLVGAGSTAGAARRADRLSLCSPTDVAVSLGVVRGSQGAGQTSYALRVKNVSSVSCRTGGLANLVLIGKHGTKLPTRISASCGNCNAVALVLRPGISAWADGRFSPDVPGPGETSPGGRCEPVAYAIRVTLPGTSGSVQGLIRPPTSVCSHGWIHLSYLGTTKPTT
jgi:Protein of unknown function (DUF4232)